MSAPGARNAQRMRFDEVVRQAVSERPGDRLSIEDLSKVRLAVTGDLGQCTMTVRDVLDLKQGSIVALNKLAGETTDVCINDVPVARGEIVVIADSLHVRIAEIIGASEKEETPDVD